jgi:hypothetical protein
MELYNMKTAVEWLANELLKEHPILTNHDAINQAKEIEKQQIIDAYQKGIYNGQTNFGYGNNVTSEQYYNETFNK